METVLVTGGLGFIGKNFIEKLLKTGVYRIVNIDAGSYAADMEFDKEMKKEHSHYHSFIVPMQYSGLKPIILSFNVKYVVNFAAESHVDNSITGPTPFFEHNVMATQHLVEELRQLEEQGGGVDRFIHISTDEVYGDLPLEGTEKFTEETAYDPSSPYSASKASSDHVVASYRRTYGLPFYITHCSNNYGPGQHGEKLIPKTVKTLNMCMPAQIYGKGENMRDWIHVDDHNRGILMLMKADEESLEGEYVFNFGGGNCINNIDMAKMLWTVMEENDYDTPKGDNIYEFVTDRKGHDLRYEVDYSRAKRLLGWEPLYDLKQGLKETVHSMLEELV
jgi:dTDP-glucose 4,6-dehydratase